MASSTLTAKYPASVFHVGVHLACVVPHFGGIDEPAQFYRSYQISTGTFLPEKFGKQAFSGAWFVRRSSGDPEQQERRDPVAERRERVAAAGRVRRVCRIHHSVLSFHRHAS